MGAADPNCTVRPSPPKVVWLHLSPRFSVVIPARNEEALLPRLLDTVDVARARFRQGADAVEVIVADNVSTDRTAAIARERRCTVVRVEQRRIASVRNGGAAVARGDVLAFVDADMRVQRTSPGATGTATTADWGPGSATSA